MFKLVIILAVIFAGSAAKNVCKTKNIINRPANSQPVYWPATWTENQTAPHLASDQSCSWAVTVPRGYYAKVIINGKTTDKDSRFQTIDSAGNFVQTTHEAMQPYYFPPYKFTIAVSNEGSATFAFKIVWLPLPTTVNEYAGIGGIAHVINATNNLYTKGFGAATGISLLPFPADRKNYYSLRSSLVFEGNDLDGNYISNLFLLYQTKKQWVSSTTQTGVIVVNLETSNHDDKLLIQAAGYTKDISEYVELVPEYNTTYTATVNGGKKKSAVISVSFINETMIDAQMDDTATVAVYYGSQDAFALDKTYTKALLKKSLPLSFYGSVVQYVVSSGKAVFTFKS